jgi:large subunit ribosomal protein L30
MAKLLITWKKSAIGYARDQKDTIRALGLHRLHQTVEQPDTRSIRGMIHKVQHLVLVEDVAQEPSVERTPRADTDNEDSHASA